MLPITTASPRADGNEAFTVRTGHKDPVEKSTFESKRPALIQRTRR